MPISKITTIRSFFEREPHGRPVTRQELMELAKDKAAYDEIACACAEVLGETLEVKTN